MERGDSFMPGISPLEKKKDDVTKTQRKRETLQRNKEMETLEEKREGGQGRIRSQPEIERTRKETEKGEDSWIKRGRKCPVMLD